MFLLLLLSAIALTGCIVYPCCRCHYEEQYKAVDVGYLLRTPGLTEMQAEEIMMAYEDMRYNQEFGASVDTINQDYIDQWENEK